MSLLLDVDGLAPKRPRVGRAHDEILGISERDIELGSVGCIARGLLLDAGVPERVGEPLADTLLAQALGLDSNFKTEPQAVIAAVLEACVAVAAAAAPSLPLPAPASPPHPTLYPHTAGLRTCPRTRLCWRA